MTAIIVISPVLGLIAIAIIIAIYIYLDRKHLETPWETVHSGLFVSIANWAAKKVFVNQTETPKRAWKPALLVPVENDKYLDGQFRLLRALTSPQGSIQAVGFIYENNDKPLKNLPQLIQDMQKEDIFATSASMDARSYSSALKASVSVMKGSFFHPNTIFENIAGRTQEELQSVVDIARSNELGVIFLAMNADVGMGRERSVNLWVRDQSPDWTIGMKMVNLEYALLLSYQLRRNWKAEVRLLSVVSEKENIPLAQDYLKSLMDVARMSSNVNIHVNHGNFLEHLAQAPRADLNIFGISPIVNREFMTQVVKTSRSSCLFVMDSGNESALA